MTHVIQNKKARPDFGEGIYLAYDVAQILKLPYYKVRNLMTGYWQSYTFGSEDSRAINFYALIEFYIFYYLKEQNFSSTEIKRLHEKLSKDFKTKHPFASLKLKINPKTDPNGKGQLWIDFNGILMKADGKLQPAFRSFIESYLKQIEFGENSLAKRFFPLATLNNSMNIVVDPLHQFGQPVINGTNIQAATVHNLYTAGETKKNISILYNIGEDVVDDVLAYYEKRA
jgi:uncharacterized protein (DUF433 family)